ncbi:HNH endonuclease, partial [Promicromonospora sp. NPDC057488]
MDGSMPDDAWLATLFAECEAWFGEYEGRHGLEVPPEPEWCETAYGGRLDTAAGFGPVVLWPEEVLREALAEAPGAELARVVAEYTGLGAASAGGAGAALAEEPDVEGGLRSVAVADGSAPLTALSDDMLGDLAAACSRLQSWAAGVQAHVVAERAGRETSPLA